MASLIITPARRCTHLYPRFSGALSVFVRSDKESRLVASRLITRNGAAFGKHIYNPLWAMKGSTFGFLLAPQCVPWRKSVYCCVVCDMVFPSKHHKQTKQPNKLKFTFLFTAVCTTPSKHSLLPVGVLWKPACLTNDGGTEYLRE